MLPKSARIRLAFRYAATVTCLIALYSAALYYLYWKNTYSDFDRQLRSDIETLEMALERSHGNPDLTEFQADPTNWISEIWDSEGRRVYTSGRPDSFPLGGPVEGAYVDSRKLEDGLRVRVLSLESEAYPDKYHLRVARLTERAAKLLSHFLSIMLLGIPLVVVASGLTGYVLARKTLAPIAAIVEKARAITADHLSERLPVENPDDELGQLARTFNETFERLEKSFTQMKRFSSDASHELRTPLAAIRAVGEVALRGDNDVSYYKEAISNILEESARLQSLCENLLLLSRADSGALPMHIEKVSAKELATEVSQLLAVLAEDKNQKIEIDIPEGVMISVDPHFFRQVLLNLVDNAIKYCQREAKIHIWAKSSLTGSVIGVKDNGPGISAESQKSIFDRFYRVDAARSRIDGGAGLGLSISSWIVEAHNGKIDVESERGRGTSFVIHLPKENFT